MDDVADEALARKTDLKAGLRVQANIEREALAVLRKLRDSRPRTWTVTKSCCAPPLRPPRTASAWRMET